MSQLEGYILIDLLFPEVFAKSVFIPYLNPAKLYDGRLAFRNSHWHASHAKALGLAWNLQSLGLKRHRSAGLHVGVV